MSFWSIFVVLTVVNPAAWLLHLIVAAAWTGDRNTLKAWRPEIEKQQRQHRAVYCRYVMTNADPLRYQEWENERWRAQWSERANARTKETFPSKPWQWAAAGVSTAVTVVMFGAG